MVFPTPHCLYIVHTEAVDNPNFPKTIESKYKSLQ